jgi:hydroxymethylpyrimidine/phosphomethylpyrimidine kinase
MSPPRVLIIAGSDSGGGAGIQGDLKTVEALGGFGTTVITAITAQNTLGVTAVHPIPPEIITAQGKAVLEDIGADAIKTGMLGARAAIEATAALLAGAHGIPAVVDPVMIAKSGAALLEDGDVEAFARLMIPQAALLTPNAPEAERLTGRAIASVDDLRRVGEALLALGPKAVLMKGGHVPGETVVDILLTADGEHRFESPRQITRHTHGTGCATASACAAGLAAGVSLPDAVAAAHAFIQGAIRYAPGLGAGAGPLLHAWRQRSAR